MVTRLHRRDVLAWLIGSGCAIPALGAGSAFATATPSRILVIGDSLAQQIGWGLTQELGGDPRFEVVNRGRPSTGLVRNDFYDWPANLSQLLNSQRFDAVVVSVGMNDRQNIAASGAVLQRFSEDWQAAYGERVDRMMGLIEDSGVPGFWMGMPISRSQSFSRGMRVINNVFEAVVTRRPGIAYVPLWSLTTDANGAYTPYGQTADGRTGVTRTDDGMHMTGFGSRMIASHLLREMGAVLQVANSR